MNDDLRIKNGTAEGTERGFVNDKLKMENGEWKMENGKRKIEPRRTQREAKIMKKVCW